MRMEGEREPVKKLQHELEEAHENLVKAAEFGKMLLEENVDIKERMDTLRAAADKSLELAEQEKHALQVKINQKLSMEAWYKEEITHLKQQLHDAQTHVRNSLEEKKAQEIAVLTRKMDGLRSDLEQAGSVEAQLRQKNQELEALLRESLDQTEHTASRSFGTSDELATLQDELHAMQMEMTSLKSQLIEMKSELSLSQKERENLHGRVAARDEEIEDMRCQFTSVNNALEQARMEKLDLKCQLDVLQMEANNHNKKGNSIFSELDDRRIDAEKKLISLKVLSDTLKEKYNVEKQQNQKYKRQISQLLLQMSSGGGDPEYVASLEHRLAQARQELRTLMEEKAQKDEAQVLAVGTHHSTESPSEPVADTEYVQYLRSIIDGKTQELEKTSQELSYKKVQLLDERSRSSQLECSLKKLEAEKEKVRSQNIKLSVKLDELRLKYEPESVQKSGILTIKRTEKIHVEEKEELKITETRRSLDNFSINQSRKSLLPAELQQTLPLLEKNENRHTSSILKGLKSRSVKISEEVEEREFENVEVGDDDVEYDHVDIKPKTKSKGRRVLEVKHVSDEKPNDCKQS